MNKAGCPSISFKQAHIYFALIYTILCSFNASGFALHDSQERYIISPEAKLFEDADGISFQAVRNLPATSFKANEVDSVSIDDSSKFYWIKFQIKYYSNSPSHYRNWFMEIAAPSLDILDIYFIENGNTTSHHLGDDRPYRVRPVQHGNYIIDFRTHSKYETIAYIRVKNSISTKLPIRVWSHQALFSESQVLQYLAGICYGILLIMVIYNLATGITIKDKCYTYLAIYILTAFVCLISYDGSARQFLWPNSLWWESRALFFWECLVVFWGIQFSRNFIDLENNYPMLVKSLYSIQFSAVLCAIVSIIIPMNMFSIFMVFAYSIITFLFMIPVAKHAHKSEKLFFILAWLPLYVVTIVLIAGKIELFDFNINSINKRYLYYPLLTAQCLLLSLALTRRYNAIKNSKEKAEQYALGSLQRYKDLFTNSTAGMFEISYNGKVLYVNPQILQILGYDSEQELLKNDNALDTSLFVNAADRKRYLRLLLKNGRVTNFEFQFKRKNGEIAWGLVSSCLVTDSDSTEYVVSKPNIEGSIVDITASKEKESIEKRLIEAETSANVKSQLLASSSHELRTPMNAIIGFTSLLQKTELDEKQFNYSEKVRIAAKGLLRLINDILDNSKLEAGEMEIESVNFNLDKLLNEVVDMFAEPFNEKGIELILLKKPDVPVDLVGDPLRINQILINLINNAMKFTSEGYVAVTIEHIPGHDDGIDLYFTVSDTGAGIVPERCERIFDPYQQANSSVAKLFGGTGLGLSVCKNLIEKMGGQINVKSAVGQGSEFMFSMHLGIQQFVGNEIETYEELAGKTAFIIDSNKLAVEQLKDELSKFKINSVSAFSGEMALQRLISLGEADQYDFIIIERNLVDAPGINIIKELKTDSSTSKIPIALTSRTGFNDLSERDRNSGINELLVKPIKSNNLIKTLISIFNLDYVPPVQDENEHNELIGLFKDKRILLVEDNELNQELFTELLAGSGAIIEIAKTGAAAIETINKSVFDIIMMDIQMPILNGIEATKIIRREHKEFADIPIIALTANVLECNIKEYSEAGMDGFIPKPIDFADLISSLKQWLNIDNNALISETNKESDAVLTCQLQQSDTIDLASGLKKLGGNKKLYYKILNDFVDTYRREKESLFILLNDKDTETLSRKLHSIKGISLNLGLDNLGEIARSAELIVKDAGLDKQNDFEKAQSLIENFYQLLEDVAAELDKLHILK
ncbi:MAG: response regulator [Gammaproteobacteria bacterium]|nr:MAG: response regulator [Gammaproteobacteria bacterium]